MYSFEHEFLLVDYDVKAPWALLKGSIIVTHAPLSPSASLRDPARNALQPPVTPCRADAHESPIEFPGDLYPGAPCSLERDCFPPCSYILGSPAA